MSLLSRYVDYTIGYARYIWGEITHPHIGNYFYWLIAISLMFWVLEMVFPWRKDQKVVRKDFWLDAFYMFFNFFIFYLVGYHAISSIGVEMFDSVLSKFGVSNLVAVEIKSMSVIGQLAVMLILRDFIHYWIHRLLHAVPFLWNFHKVHHSVEEMGFAAHLRFHWMETLVYRTLEYIPLAMVGFGITEFLWLHLFTITWGHFNHANITVPLGPLKYLFNNPQMHIWHHAKSQPKRSGSNFGLTLSLWDYLFSTAHIPKDGKSEELGFDHVKEYPRSFLGQILEPFRKK